MSNSVVENLRIATIVAIFVAGSLLLSAGDSPPFYPSGSNQRACPSSGEISDQVSGALTHVRYLADDALAGREVGSPGAYCAADYIASQLQAIGLEPMGDNSSFFQIFPIRAGAELQADNSLRLPAGTLGLGDAWSPYGFSGSGETSAALIYGGDGVNRPAASVNPYPRMSLDGKIVVLEYGDSQASGVMPMHGTTHFKARVAQGRRAAGVIVLLPDGMGLPDLVAEARQFLRIPVAAVSGRQATEVREAARNADVVQMDTQVQAREVGARNVVAVIPGSDPYHRDEVVIVGAHYDHLGLGGEGALGDGQGQIHNGADDNASGTAAMIEVARELQKLRPARTVMFIAFTGEERGMWGSDYYVRNPVLPLGTTVAMLNLDMVGRLRGGPMTIFGTGTAVEWEDVIRTSNDGLEGPVRYSVSPTGQGASDHASFYRQGLPVLHFYTNSHEDYHRPSDDWQKIDGPGLARVVDLVSEIALRVAGSATTDAATITFSPPRPR